MRRWIVVLANAFAFALLGLTGAAFASPIVFSGFTLYGPRLFSGRYTVLDFVSSVSGFEQSTSYLSGVSAYYTHDFAGLTSAADSAVGMLLTGPVGSMFVLLPSLSLSGSGAAVSEPLGLGAFVTGVAAIAFVWQHRRLRRAG